MHSQPVKQPPPALSKSSTADSLPLTTSNYDLNRASHPKACVFTFLFKALALLFYFLPESVGQVFVFIMVVLFSAFDFWTVKNVTGR